MLKHALKIKNGWNIGQNAVLNPLDFLLEWIVRIVAHLLIPIPLAAEVLVQFKGIVLAIILNAVLVVITCFIVILSVIRGLSLPQNAIANIYIPADGSFIATNIPMQNPLGGQGLSWVKITAGFMDANYAFFGGIHTGVDFIPSEEYYHSSKSYQEAGEVIVYSTVNGKANFYVDKYGSNTLEITNNDNTIKTIFTHLEKVFVSSGKTITAGEAISTMGNTGFSTGRHLHYEIRVNENDKWIPINPLGYIQ